MKKVLYQIILIILLISCKKEVDTTTGPTWEINNDGDVLAVEVLSLTKGYLYPSISSAGIVSGIAEAYIVSETQGIIEEVSFEIGDMVNTTDTLVKVDDTISELSMEQAKQQFDTAKLDLESTENQYEKGNVSLVQLTRARSSLNGSKALYESALKVYQSNSIKSPIEGAVAWKESSVTKGNLLQQNSRIARIVDMSSIKVNLSLGERQIGLIKIGDEVDIIISALKGFDPIKGEVKAIAAGSDQKTGSFSIIVEASNPYGYEIKSGMSCLVEISTKSGAPEFIIPTDAVYKRDGKEYIFVDRSGISEPIEIIVNEVVGNRTSINVDLKETENLIISSLSTMKPGLKVKSRNIGNSGDWL